MEETYLDVLKFNLKSGNSSQKPEDNMENNNNRTKAKVNIDPKALYYDMSGEKRLIIFNHYSYKPTRYYNYSAPAERKGTEKDVSRLKSVFGELLGFEINIYDDLDYENIWNILTGLNKEDLSALSCISIAILTHGSYGGILYAADRGYELRDVFKLFETNHTLVNKPKLFFIQACRGREMDDGKTVYTDGDTNNDSFVVPSHADFLTMRSTVEEYISYRDFRGSWLIQELCEAIENHYEDQNLLEIITRVNRQIAYNYQTHTPRDKKTHSKKQMPETSFTLTKILRLKVKE